MIDAADELRRFDLFDVEAYDEVLAQVNRDLADGTIPPLEARIAVSYTHLTLPTTLLV